MRDRIRNTALYKMYRKMSVRNKMLFAVYLILVPTIIFASAFTTVTSYQDTIENMAGVYQRFTWNVSNDISYIQQDVMDISNYLAVNADVHNVLISSADAYADDKLFWDTNTPLSMLKDILAIKSSIRTLILYPENGLLPFYVSRDGSVQSKDIDVVAGSECYRKAQEADGDIVWARVNRSDRELYIDNKSDKIVACRILYDLSKKHKIGFLVIGCDVVSYERVCLGMLQNENEGIVVVGGEGEEFARVGTVDDGLLQKLKYREDIWEQKEAHGFVKLDGYYVFHAENGETGIQVYYMSPRSNWNSQIMQNLTLPILLLIVLLVCSWPISRIAAYSMARPMENLNRAMDRFKNGDFDQQIPVETNDELGQLADAFNQMARDTKNLIDRNYVMALREKQSELDALEAQINPHFLYNVLDSLYWRATDDDNEKIAEDILTLSKLFRILLSKGRSQIPVGQEIELISSYLQIQKMRFMKRLAYEIDVEPEILEERISKLTIQPFVENAVVHGLENREKGGTVKVTGRSEGKYMRFLVEDDGSGMSQEEIDRILHGEDMKNYASSRIGGYAIYNIRQRLILQYGDDFSLTIKSGIDRGTRVDIFIPKIMEENGGEMRDGRENVQPAAGG